MNLLFNQDLARGYKSKSQIARVLSEDWVLKNMFCPSCSYSFDKTKNNTRVLDFTCKNIECGERFELKSSKKSKKHKISDGAYCAIMEKIYNNTVPNFLFLHYDEIDKSVVSLFAVPKYIFIPDMIEKRKPLSECAKRKGWVGCNILTGSIPEEYKIFYVRDGERHLKREVVNAWKKTLFLKDKYGGGQKGWIIDIVRCIEKLNKNFFYLNELYGFEDFLKMKYPDNKHIKEKIRQQLQILRNNGYLDFISRGMYKLK